MRRINAAISILLKYIEPSADASISAGHDVIYLTGPVPEKVAIQDLIELEKLRCDYDTDLTC